MTTVTAKQKKSIAQVQLALKLLCVPTEFHLLTSTNGIRILDIQIKHGGWISFLEEIQQTQYVPTQGGKTVKLETCGQRQEKQGKHADEVVSRR